MSDTDEITVPLSTAQVDKMLQDHAEQRAKVEKMLRRMGMSPETMRDRAHKSGIHKIGAMFRQLEGKRDGLYIFEPKPPRKVVRRRMRV